MKWKREQKGKKRARAVMVGMRILCSVLLYPSTFSPKELSSSAGKGSRAPKSPRNSFTSMARVTRSEGDDDAPRPRARREVGARGGHAMGRATGSTRLRLRVPVMAMYACALTLSCVMVVVGWVGKLEWIKRKVLLLLELLVFVGAMSAFHLFGVFLCVSCNFSSPWVSPHGICTIIYFTIY